MTNLDRLWQLLDCTDSMPLDEELYGLAADHIEALELQLSRLKSFFDDVLSSPTIPYKREIEL